MALDAVLRKFKGESVTPVTPVTLPDVTPETPCLLAVTPVTCVTPENDDGEPLDYTMADIEELDLLINEVCDRHGYPKSARQKMLHARQIMMPALMREQLNYFRDLMQITLKGN